ncbi:ankyrin repeat domain-containing protein [Psychromarinibacter halotolerans]|uniref:Ankyrin repeat domain-containing protein n=1 Tax=Psychromarinibacter halotolerans TaxID=1775175 RepID=A0ABV7GQP6_9RHOB|nr:ankyrin repeat domain-containing protein [Psychromarinibacter halotolerans]MDF0598871.1 ankyrin repeat domain-containing protein [Psychromarinibacter halotolerans]
MTHHPDKLRRVAKGLRKAFEAGDPAAVARVHAVLPKAQTLRHTDALHVIAREEGFASWPRLKFAAEALNMDRAAKAARLDTALYLGQHWVVQMLLADVPDLGRDDLGLACALYDIDHVHAVLAHDRTAAVRPVRGRRPILHLAFSQHLHGGGDPDSMLQVADALLAAGADVNDSYAYQGDPASPLSALYGAVGHANNMALAQWLLTHGADPNDNESLYHSTELGHRDGLRLLLAHGARPEGTNALPRALDFNDHEAVRLLLGAGADPNEGIVQHPSGEPPFVIPALHQAARRMCDATMAGLLLDAGADPSAQYRGVTPYALARVFGNGAAADRIAAAGGDTRLTPEETLLAAAAEDRLPPGARLAEDGLPDVYRVLPRELLHLPGKFPHIQRLIELGLDPDVTDQMGLPPVQIAGWEGLPEQLSFFLSLKPNLRHINEYGGDLLSTIIHGSENCPARNDPSEHRDHVACARLALDAGVPLPRRVIAFAGDEGMAAFLADWAQAHPEQVTDPTP